jgi:hypothetical protein
MKNAWPLLIAIGVALLGLAQQIYMLVTTPWANDTLHWSSVAIIILLCIGVPFPFVYLRWRHGSVASHALLRFVLARTSNGPLLLKNLAIWVTVVFALVVLVTIRK